MIYNVQSVDYVQGDHIEVRYFVKLPGNVISHHIDYIYSRPKGWTHLSFSEDLPVSYSDFLNTMVEKNVDVCRKMAKLELDTIVKELDPSKSTKTFIKIMNALKILDPTFDPPFINVKCGWQKHLLNEICSSTSFHVISLCRNHVRLQRYFNLLKVIS